MILEAPDLLAFKPRTQAGARRHHADFLARNGGKPPHHDDRPVAPHVSENRWVAECPSCSSGMLCWSENPECYCYRCGSIFRVSWPKDKAQAERVLEDRPPANRHWNPRTESVKKLERENDLMRDIESRPVIVPVEPLRAVFQVEHCHEGQLDDELLRLAKTAYVIRYDRDEQVAEVELTGREDREAERIKKQLVGK